MARPVSTATMSRQAPMAPAVLADHPSSMAPVPGTVAPLCSRRWQMRLPLAEAVDGVAGMVVDLDMVRDRPHNLPHVVTEETRRHTSHHGHPAVQLLPATPRQQLVETMTSQKKQWTVRLME